MKLGDKVIIGGRTMLRPGFSLVGLTGRIVSSRADAPPGTLAVWMDWQDFGYENLDELPPVVNVPTVHLSLAEPDEPESNERKPAAPSSTKESQNESNGERPKLRLL